MQTTSGGQIKRSIVWPPHFAPDDAAAYASFGRLVAIRRWPSVFLAFARLHPCPSLACFLFRRGSGTPLEASPSRSRLSSRLLVAFRLPDRFPARSLASKTETARQPLLLATATGLPAVNEKTSRYS